MAPDHPPFRFWLRRSAAGGNRCALRFEVFDGLGVLRVARPGVLVDPPARESGYEAELTLTQVRSSRFLHLSAADRRHQLYFLSRVADELVLPLEPEIWVELRAAVDRGARHLLLHALEGASRGELWPSSPERASAAADPVRRVDILPSSALAKPGERAERQEGARAGPGRAPPPPPERAPPTSLVRYLRRELAEARAENRVLLARVKTLEGRLAALEALPEPAEAERAAPLRD